MNDCFQETENASNFRNRLTTTESEEEEEDEEEEEEEDEGVEVKGFPLKLSKFKGFQSKKVIY